MTVFDRTKLDETGISSVADLMNFISQQPYRSSEIMTENSAQYAETRGIGFDATLVLINGRRTIASSASAAWNAFDLNTLPLAAVERVEVLSDSSSAVYGTDAIGGVVNFITKGKIPRPVLDVHFGGAEGGADEHRASLSAGYSNERLTGTLVLDYFERGALLGAERDRWNNQDYRRFGGQDYRAFLSNPGNVTSLTSANLPGLPSRFAAIPIGSTGIGLTPNDFLPTAGQRNSDSLYRYRAIVKASERRSLFASADFHLTPTVSAFGEFFYLDDSSVGNAAPATRTLVVPAENPFNPFGVPVSVDYFFEGLEPINRLESARYRAVAGLLGALRDWDWEVSLMKIRDEASTWTENGLNAAKINAALAEKDPSRALNVFRDGPGGSAELLESLTAAPSKRPYASYGTHVAALARGSLVDLPAGPLDIVLGGEWLASDIVLLGTLRVQNGRSATAGFTELRVPVLSSDMGIPFVEKLSLTLASRYDRYSDFGDSLNSQYGIVWSPLAELTWRASYGTSFRAPSLFELYASRVTTVNLLPDPLRNNEFTQVTVVGGGNRDLDAVEADSLITGFEWTPALLHGLTLSAHYWHLGIDKRVSALPYNVITEHWERFPDRAIRVERTAEDTAAGRPGKLLFLDLSRINFGTTETSGIDINATYNFDTPVGRFSPSVSATWLEKYEISEIPGAPATNRLGVADLRGTIARWKAIATLAWNRNGVGLSAMARYTAGYADTDSFRRVTGRIVPAQTLIDVQGSLNLDQALGLRTFWLPALKVTAGVSNLFDEAPPFAQAGQVFGFDTTQGDLRQRFAYLRLSAQF